MEFLRGDGCPMCARMRACTCVRVLPAVRACVHACECVPPTRLYLTAMGPTASHGQDLLLGGFDGFYTYFAVIRFFMWW